MTPAYVSEVSEILELEREIAERKRLEATFNKIVTYYPDDGPLRRELYPRQIEFFAAGQTFTERCFMAANRSGKTVAGAYEMSVHLTGLYPPWWTGRRFDHAVTAWAAGDTNQTTRDILQAELLGKLVRQPGDRSSDSIGLGTGMIPRDTIRHTTPKSGMPNAIEQVWVNHVSGETSTLGFKSYDQGRESFQGTAQHIIWADEEVDESVYTEMLMRTMTTNGIVYITFTPLNGITALVQKFLPESMLT